MQRKNELKELETRKEYYKKKIDETQQELKSLASNPASVEKYAREQYLMKKDNEDLFIVVSPNDTLKK